MSEYKQKLNPRTGQFNLVPENVVLAFKESVADEAHLPSSGNIIGDARITNNNNNLYVWDGFVWQNQGDILDLEWNAISGKPSSNPTNIDDSVSKRHTQGTDQNLDVGGANTVSASDLKGVVNGTVNGIILGTTDAFSRRQIWNKLTDAILRLGSLASDGDATNVISQGSVMYGKNLQGDEMSSDNFAYVRLKPNRIGLYNSKLGGYVGYIIRMDTTEDEWYITDNDGNKKFKLYRSTGQLVLSSLSDGTNIIIISDLKDAVDKKHTQNTDQYLDFGGLNQIAVSDVTKKSGSITQITTRNHSDLQNKNAETDIKHVTDNQKDALGAANSPTTSNCFITKNDIKVKEIFISGTNYNGDKGNFRARQMNTSDSFRFTFSVPLDFVSLISIELIGIIGPAAALTNRDIDLNSDYGLIGEIYNNHTESDTTSTYDLSAYSNKIYNLNIATVFSLLAAGDFCGFLVTHNTIGGTINYLGIRLRYNRS